MFFKLIVYIGSWIFRGILELSYIIHWESPGWWLKLTFIHQRVHLSLFLFLFMDLISYSFSVTTVGAKLFQAVLGYIALILLSADLIELADVMVRNWRWSYRLK